MGKKTQSLDDIEAQIAALQARKAELLVGQAGPAPKAAKKGRASVQTSGGSVVSGGVKLSNGHFIGRDSIRVINQVASKGEDAEHAKLALASYLHVLATELAGVKLGDIDASTDQTRQDPLQLPDIYVPLDTTFAVPVGTRLEVAIEAGGTGETMMLGKRRRGRRTEQVELRPATAIEALSTHQRLTLLGAPGSGKSTFGAHVLLALAQAWQGRAKLADSLGKDWKAGQPLPVRVVLREFAERHATGAHEPTAGDLWSFIGQSLERSGWGEARAAMRAVQNLARKHGALVLFDGLDECGDAPRRERVLKAVQAFVASAGDRSRFLVTARPYAYPQGADARKAIYQLAELDEARIEAFIGRWYDALVKRKWQQPGPADEKRKDLLSAFRRPDLLHLAGNPLLLTLMATLHSNRGRLPDDRADLYEETVTLLLQRWNSDVGADRALLKSLNVEGLALRDFRQALQRLAFEVHAANEGREGLADITEGRLLRSFQRLVGGSLDKAREVVDFIERRAGLLLGLGPLADGEGRFTFPHRTFQEFLAACHLSGQQAFARECRELAERSPNHWREVLPLAARLAGAERGAAAANELVGACDPDPAAGPALAAGWPRVHLAALMLKEIGPLQLDQSRGTQEVARRVKSWLLRGMPLHPSEGGARAPLRAAMGELLSALGDPRFDPQRLFLPAGDPMLGFVPIGTPPAFAIGRYPVTVAQFRCSMLEIGGGREPSWIHTDTASRPARSVAWSEAVAYACWLQDELLNNPALAGTEAARWVRERGWRICLSSDREWELAARGGLEQKLFPWGDDVDPERANTKESEVSDSSVVGCFPGNGFGLFDMAGNVWEWTRSGGEGQASRGEVTADSTFTPDPSDYFVCGGWFAGPAQDAHCEFRVPLLPDGPLDILGFRVVLTSEPSR